jgi:hypothetical protein
MSRRASIDNQLQHLRREVRRARGEPDRWPPACDVAMLTDDELERLATVAAAAEAGDEAARAAVLELVAAANLRDVRPDAGRRPVSVSPAPTFAEQAAAEREARTDPRVMRCGPATLRFAFDPHPPDAEAIVERHREGGRAQLPIGSPRPAERSSPVADASDDRAPAPVSASPSGAVLTPESGAAAVEPAAGSVTRRLGAVTELEQREERAADPANPLAWRRKPRSPSIRDMEF